MFAHYSSPSSPLLLLPCFLEGNRLPLGGRAWKVQQEFVSHQTKQKIFLYKVFQCSCQQHYLLWHLKLQNVTSWRKIINHLASNPTCQYLTIRGMRPNNQLSLSAELHFGTINEAEPSLMLSLPPGCLSQCLLWIKSNPERLGDFHVLNVVTRRRTFVFSC